MVGGDEGFADSTGDLSRVNDEFVFEVKEGYHGLFGCVGAGGEDVGGEVS